MNRNSLPEQSDVLLCIAGDDCGGLHGGGEQAHEEGHTQEDGGSNHTRAKGPHLLL